MKVDREGESSWLKGHPLLSKSHRLFFLNPLIALKNDASNCLQALSFYNY